MSILRHSVLMVLFLLGLGLHAADTDLYASLSYDQANHTVTGYAGTLGDYSTALYYDTWACATLLKDGAQVDYQCLRSSNDYSEVWTHDYNAYGGNTYDLNTIHRIDAIYQYYQIVYDCGPYCSGYWGDYYGYSLLSTAGAPLEYNTTYYAPAQTVATQSSTSLLEDGHRRISTACNLPWGEQSQFISFGAYPTETLGYWRQTLNGLGPTYYARTVREADGGVNRPDSCFSPDSAYMQVTSIPEKGAWSVGVQPPGWPVGQPWNTTLDWAFDGIGWKPDAVRYYQNKWRYVGNKLPCGVALIQSMLISCGTGYPEYTRGVIEMYVTSTGAQSGRNGQLAERSYQ